MTLGRHIIIDSDSDSDNETVPPTKPDVQESKIKSEIILESPQKPFKSLTKSQTNLPQNGSNKTQKMDKDDDSDSNSDSDEDIPLSKIKPEPKSSPIKSKSIESTHSSNQSMKSVSDDDDSEEDIPIAKLVTKKKVSKRSADSSDVEVSFFQDYF
jgi:hypothetical protein